MSLRNPSCPFCGMPPLDGEPCCKRGQSNKPAPAAPVTDADIEAAISGMVASLCASCMPYLHEVANLRALIARRLQQATAAAEDLARAVESATKINLAVAVLALGCDTMRRDRVRDFVAAAIGQLESALAAFRKAQGGGA